MAGHEALMMARARRAYEHGRLSAALCRSAALTPIAALALLCCRHPAAPLAATAGLIAVVTFCLWRGGAWRSGVGPGLMSGAAPLLIPFLAHAAGTACSASGCAIDPAPCLLAGLAGGLALGFVAPRRRNTHDGASRGSPFGIPLLSACLVAGLAGAVGCGLFGLIGVAGMIAGLAAGAAPVLAARVARA